MNAENYTKALRAQGIPEFIIEDLQSRYPDIPGQVIYKLLEDDNRMGIGRLSIPYSNQEVRVHDLCMSLAKLNYPVTTNLETQAQFFTGTIERGFKGMAFGVAAIPIAVVGATVGGIIWAIREWL